MFKVQYEMADNSGWLETTWWDPGKADDVARQLVARERHPGGPIIRATVIEQDGSVYSEHNYAD